MRSHRMERQIVGCRHLCLSIRRAPESASPAVHPPTKPNQPAKTGGGKGLSCPSEIRQAVHWETQGHHGYLQPDTLPGTELERV